MRRLIRRSDDISKIYKNMLNNLGKDGRELLKQVENYKFKISKSINILNDEKIQKDIKKCVEDLSNVSAFIYDFVFDLENYDIVDTNFNRQIEFTIDKKDDLNEDEKNNKNDDDKKDNKNNDSEKYDTEDNKSNNEENNSDKENDDSTLETPKKELEDDLSELFDNANENDNKL